MRKAIHAHRSSGHSTAERFLMKVNAGEGDECWTWLGHKNEQGYGYFWLNNKMRLAHRLAYMFEHHVSLDRDTAVCHRCDNPSCVRPSHLFLGSLADNNHDRDRKGRQARLLGLANGRGILSDEQCSDIIDRTTRGERPVDIAMDYTQVSYSCVYNIGRGWSRKAGKV